MMDNDTRPPLIPQGDEAVQNTTDDAASSKLSASNFGYFSDPYLKYFVTKPTRRAPLINRGYYARVHAIRECITKFIQDFEGLDKIQIVSIGSGLDTTCFWAYQKCNKIHFFEIDFPDIINRKVNIIKGNEELWSILVPSVDTLDRDEKDHIQSETLTMISIDIRNTNALDYEIKSSNFDLNIPTLFICECVLVYLESSYSDKLIEWASKLCIAPSVIIVYEQTRPDDPFGRTMMKNLEARGCPLYGLVSYPSLISQKNRYIKLGWKDCLIYDLDNYYLYVINKSELKRIEKIELFDEFEEWTLIQRHYFILCAFNDDRGNNLSNIKDLFSKTQHI